MNTAIVTRQTLRHQQTQPIKLKSKLLNLSKQHPHCFAFVFISQANDH